MDQGALSGSLARGGALGLFIPWLITQFKLFFGLSGKKARHAVIVIGLVWAILNAIYEGLAQGQDAFTAVTSGVVAGIGAVFGSEGLYSMVIRTEKELDREGEG